MRVDARVADKADITHDLFDAVPQDPRPGYVREVLVATGVLTRRHETLTRVELAVDGFRQ
jgi:hypothetical protein